MCAATSHHLFLTLMGSCFGFLPLGKFFPEVHSSGTFIYLSKSIRCLGFGTACTELGTPTDIGRGWI